MLSYHLKTISLIKDYHLLLIDYYQLAHVQIEKIQKLAYKYHSECEYITLTYPIESYKDHFYDEMELSLTSHKSIFFIVLPEEMNKEDYQDLLKHVYENKEDIRFVFIPLNHDPYYLKQLELTLLKYMNIKVIDGRKESIDYVYDLVCNLFKDIYIDVLSMDKTIYKHIHYLLENTYLNENELKTRIIDDLIKKEFKNERLSYRKINFIE